MSHAHSLECLLYSFLIVHESRFEGARKTNRKLLCSLTLSQFYSYISFSLRAIFSPFVFLEQISRGLQNFTAMLEIKEKKENVTRQRRKKSHQGEKQSRNSHSSTESNHNTYGKQVLADHTLWACLTRNCSNYCDYCRHSTDALSRDFEFHR